MKHIETEIKHLPKHTKTNSYTNIPTSRHNLLQHLTTTSSSHLQLLLPLSPLSWPPPGAPPAAAPKCSPPSSPPQWRPQPAAPRGPGAPPGPRVLKALQLVQLVRLSPVQSALWGAPGCKTVSGFRKGTAVEIGNPKKGNGWFLLLCSSSKHLH